MNKQASYSKYQKKVIKFLYDLLGVDTPFSFERAQNNHLKILIDGVPKPLYTGSTPSDTKAINNFMAEVKRHVALSKKEAEDAEVEAKAEEIVEAENEAVTKQNLPISMQASLDKIIQTCLKSKASL